jgi:hypothetical protein
MNPLVVVVVSSGSWAMVEINTKTINVKSKAGSFIIAKMTGVTKQ